MMTDAKQFLLELADLMDKFGVEEVEATDEVRGYDRVKTGIEFTIPTRWDDGEMTRDDQSVNVGNWTDANSLRVQAEAMR